MVVHGDLFKILTSYMEKAYSTEASGDIQKLLENPKLKSLQELHTELQIRFAIYLSDSPSNTVWDYVAKTKIGFLYESKIIEVLSRP